MPVRHFSVALSSAVRDVVRQLMKKSSQATRANTVERLEDRRLLAATPGVDVANLGTLQAPYARAMTGALGSRNTADIYSFKLSEPTDLQISLSRMSGDANLMLKRGRDVLAVSREGGRNPDSINQILQPGTYHLSVVAAESLAVMQYNLALTSHNAAPSSIEAVAWGGNSGIVRWIDNAQAETGYRVDQWRGGQWKTVSWAPADSTLAVISGLSPNASTTYRVRAMTESGSLVSQHVVMRTAASSSASLYRVNGVSYAGSPEAGWTYTQGEDGDLNVKSEFAGEWILAGSWQEAVAIAVEGTVQIHPGSSSSPVEHDFGNGGDFWVDEAWFIKQWAEENSSPAVSSELSSEAGRVIALEDSYGGIDEDYDDFYWTVDVDERPLPVVTIATEQSTLREGDENVAVFVVTRDSDVGSLSVPIRLTVPGEGQTGIATPLEDYSVDGATLTGNDDEFTVTFSDGQTEKIIRLSATKDSDVEGEEAVTATLYDEYGTEDYTIGAPSSAVATIEDIAVVTIEPYGAEGGAGEPVEIPEATLRESAFVVRRSVDHGALSVPVLFGAYVQGTAGFAAMANLTTADFVPLDYSLNGAEDGIIVEFASGELAKTIDLTTFFNVAIEGDEWVVATLAEPSSSDDYVLGEGGDSSLAAIADLPVELKEFVVTDANDPNATVEGSLPASKLAVTATADGSADVELTADWIPLLPLMASSARWAAYNNAGIMVGSGNFFDLTVAVNLNPTTQGGAPLMTRFHFVAGIDMDGDEVLDEEEFASAVDVDVIAPPEPFVDDQVGARHNQRVDIHGVPLPDPSPTGEGEADRIPNMAYIDAYSLTPSFSTTDVAVPMPGGDLLMEFRRTLSVDSDVTTLDLNAGPNVNARFSGENVLGDGWSTNLNSRVMLTYTANPIQGQSTFKATLYDEAGSAMGYRANGVSVGTKMTPDVRSSFSNSALKGELEVTGVSGGTPSSFVLTKKFGTELYYSRQAQIDRSKDLDGSSVDYYFRLDKIVDRNGNELRYDYASDPLLVTTIYDPSLGDEDTSARKIDFGYAGSGAGSRLVSVTDPLDRTFSYAYESGRLASVEKPPVEDPDDPGELPAEGPKVEFDYYTPPASVLLTYRSDTTAVPNEIDGLDDKKFIRWTLPKSITDARGHVTGFTYDFNLRPSYVTADQGDVKFGWDWKPEVQSVTTADGTATFAQTRAHFTSSTTEVTDTLGQKTTYVFDSDVVEFANSLGFAIASDSVTRTSEDVRDASGNLTDLTVVYEYSGDVNGNLAQVTDISGNKVKFEYATSGHRLFGLPSKSVLAADELDIQTTYNYGAFNKLIQQVDGEGRVTKYTLDAYGNRTEMIEAFGTGDEATSTYDYDSTGFMTRSTDPEGRVTEYVANGFGHIEYTVLKGFTGEDLTPLHGTSPFPTIDSAGKWLVTRRVADVMDRTLEEYGGQGYVTGYDYDNWDRVIATTLPEVIDPDWDPLGVDPADTAGGTSYIRYDFNSNVVKEIDELGNVTLHAYDALNRKTETRRRMEDPDANDASDILTSWTYNDVGMVETSTDALGRVTAHDYDALLREIKTLLPDVTEVTTPGSTSTSPGTTVREYTVKKYYGSNAGSGAFTFGGFNPTRVINARGYATDTQYDDAYRAVKVIRRSDDGSSIASTVSQRTGEPATATSYNKVHKPIVVATFNETRSGTAANRSAFTFYDNRYRPTATALDFDGDGAGITAGTFVSGGGSYSFDSDDLVTRTEYDDSSNVVAAIDALGRRAETDYDGANRAIESRQPEVDIHVPGTGVVSDFVAATTTVYDQASRPIIVTDARGTQSYTEYDPRGRAVLSVLDLDHNGVFDRVPGTAADDIIAWTGYDLAGNRIYSIDPNGNRSDTEYDRAYRAVQVQGAAVADAENSGLPTRPVTTTTYDKAGNVLTVTDPRGIAVSTTYDEWNRARTVTANSGGGVNDADRVTTESRYDASGNKVALVLYNRVGSTDRPQVTTYTFDAYERQLTETLPDIGDSQARVTSTIYSRSGDMLTVIDPKGQATETDYDLAGRVVEQRLKNNLGVTQETRESTYDKAGNLLTRTDLHGASAYAYDALNRVTDEVRTTTTTGIADTSIVLSGYDASGNRSRVIYPTDAGVTGGRELVSIYDRANRMVQLSDGVTDVQPSTFDYDPAGNRRRYRAVNDVVTETTFDAANRVLTHTAVNENGGGTTIYDIAYAYDLAGQRRSAEEFIYNHGSRAIVWDYDDVYRLTGESWNGSEEQARAYTYDKAGNRLTQSVTPDVGSPTSTTHTYDDLNQLVSSSGDGAATYTHDLNGNRLTKDVAGDTTTYVYDISDRLVGVKDDSNVTLFTAAYDARTRRLAKAEGGATKLFRYDGGTNFQELAVGTDANDDADNVLQAELIRAGGLGGGIGSVLYSDDITSVDSDSVEFFIYNAIGSTVALGDYSSAVTQSTLYEAFGEVVAQSGGSTNNRLRNTKERDASIGLDNDGFRYYDPATGRYIQRDPLGYSDGMNTYHSVRNDPVNRLDPNGLSTLGAHAKMTLEAYKAHAAVGGNYNTDVANGLMNGVRAPDLPVAMDVGKSLPLAKGVEAKMKFEELMQPVEEFMKPVADKKKEWSEKTWENSKAAVKYTSTTLYDNLRGLRNWWQDSSILEPVLKKGGDIAPGAGVRQGFQELYKTHFGENSWRHAMSNGAWTAAEIQDKLVENTAIQIEAYRQAMSGGDHYAAGFALGQGIHYLQDSYSPSHAVRSDDGRISHFQEYGQQSPELHGRADVVGLHDAHFNKVSGKTRDLMDLANGKMSGQDLRNHLRREYYALKENARAGGTERQYEPRK